MSKKNSQNTKKAVGLISGGLDSLLSAVILRDLGFKVIGLNFNTGFTGRCRDPVKEDDRRQRKSISEIGEQLGIEVRVIDISDEYLEVLLNPEYGYGSAVNPCIDCHIFMLKKAKRVMQEEDASFVFTGEVLGQRPMSQHLPTLRLIERESGLAGYLLRPLSAKLLDPTIPELDGMVEREKLFAFSGRSRKPQMELARNLGLEGYQQPAGGCLLTDKSFGRKFRDLLGHLKDKSPSREDIMLLSLGRHFRLSERVKAVSGRDEEENEALDKMLSGKPRLQVDDGRGSAVYIVGDPTEDEIITAAGIAARYCHASVSENTLKSVRFIQYDCERIIDSAPLLDERLAEMRVY